MGNYHYRHIKNLLRNKSFGDLTWIDKLNLMGLFEPIQIQEDIMSSLVGFVRVDKFAECHFMTVNAGKPVMWIRQNSENVIYYMGIDIFHFLRLINTMHKNYFNNITAQCIRGKLASSWFDLRDIYAYAADYLGFEVKKRWRYNFSAAKMREFYKKDVKTTEDAEILFAKIFTKYIQLVAKLDRENGLKGGRPKMCNA